MKYIYALCEKESKPFYVGVTEDMVRREKEHRYSSKKGHEAKYQFIRKLQAEGKDWEMILLEKVTPECDRYEDFWTYTLTLEGYELQNERAGDSVQAAERDAMLVMQGRGARFANAKEFLDARDREILEVDARRKAEKLRAKTRTKIIDVERTIFVGEDPNKKFMSPGVRAMLARRP